MTHAVLTVASRAAPLGGRRWGGIVVVGLCWSPHLGWHAGVERLNLASCTPPLVDSAVDAADVAPTICCTYA